MDSSNEGAVDDCLKRLGIKKSIYRTETVKFPVSA